MQNNNSLDINSPFLLRKLWLVILFIIITPIALGTSIFSLTTIRKASQNEKTSESIYEIPSSGVQVYASLPSDFPSVSGEVLGADARIEMIRQYLDFYNSPLEPYAASIVKAADINGLDYRLTTAIAQQESNLCKKIPAGSHNCWGWGIHSQGRLGFSSFVEGVNTVSIGIKEDYIDQGYSTVDEIMAKYTPQSEGSWAFGVNKFMNQLQ